MDQLKVILAALKKHHFWVLGGVVLILLLGIWWQSTAGIAKEYDGRKGTLKRHFQEISDLSGAVDPPNEGVIAAIVRVHDKLFDNVLKAWKYLYEQQQEKNRLPDDLGPEFIARWNSLKADDPIPDEYRDIYWTFITNYLPRQRKRAEIWRPKEGQEEHRKAAGGLMPEGGRHRDEDVEYVGKVVWDPGNYEQFQVRLNWSRRPSTEQIRLAQEDLWVCDTLLNIVRDLNEGAQSHYSAPVKRIVALDIGREATKAFAEAQNALQFGNLLGAAGTSGTAAPGANPMDEGRSQPQMMEPGMMGEGPMGMEMGPGMMMPGNLALGDGLLAGRYVNESAQPIPVEKGIAKHPYREFKMMPIRLSLVMDQRKIPELMVQCANSNMPIRVRQLRLSPGQGAKVDYLGQTATAPGRNLMPAAGSPRERGNFPMGLPGEMGNPQAGGGEDMMPGAGGLRGAGKGSYRGPYDMPVEILGIIYIYNFADPKALGKGPAEPGTESAPAPTTPATTPSTTPGTTPAVPPGTAPAVPPGTTPALPPGTTPAVPPGTTPAVPPGTTPAVPPGTAPATVPATTPAAKPGTAPAEAPAKG